MSKPTTKNRVGAALAATSLVIAGATPAQRTRVCVDFPPILRVAVEKRAEHYKVSTTRVIVAALSWFVAHAAFDELPPLLFDPDNLKKIETNWPRTMTFQADSELVEAIDKLASDGQYGSDRSATVRHALCYYLSAAGTKYQGRFQEDSHLL